MMCTFAPTRWCVRIRRMSVLSRRVASAILLSLQLLLATRGFAWMNPASGMAAPAASPSQHVMAAAAEGDCSTAPGAPAVDSMDEEERAAHIAMGHEVPPRAHDGGCTPAPEPCHDATACHAGTPCCAPTLTAAAIRVVAAEQIAGDVHVELAPQRLVAASSSEFRRQPPATAPPLGA